MTNRDLPTVLDAIISLIPDGDHDDLKASLKSIKQSSLFAAPEVQGTWWRHAANMLDTHIPEPTERWQLDIAKVFTGA